jgi:4a-hydroxytetrahydrobiopterin dehydratase
MKTYNQAEIEEQLKSRSLTGWEASDQSIKKNLVFKDFKEALDFMVKAGAIAEELNHHPDWSNVYNKVNIKLSTHDAGGVTDKDFELAQRMDDLRK